MGTERDETLPAAGPPPPSGHALSIGTQAAGRYRIARLLGTGGMGEVYEAEDLIVGGRVALKTLLPDLAGSTSAAERFRREIALARKVTSPHICRLHDVGTHEGRPFITMELLAGSTLADRVKAEGALPIAEVERLARQLIAGLGALHAAGIVHRDFKTANVMLVDERAVITDFGLARSTVDQDSTITIDGGLLGTPAYMAPEQVEARPATAASDIYALGVVLFELATGKLPFREDTAMATATARLSHDPPRPSSVNPKVPAAWDAIILRCLARDPAKRPELADVLGAAPKRSRRWIGVAAVAALATTGAVGWMQRDSEQVVDPASDALRQVTIDPVKLDGPVKPRLMAAISPEGDGDILEDPFRAALAIDVYDALSTIGIPLLSIDGGQMWEMPGGTAQILATEKDPTAAAWKLSSVDTVVRMKVRKRTAPTDTIYVGVTIERRGDPHVERLAIERKPGEVWDLPEELATMVSDRLGGFQPRRPRDAAALDLALYERYGNALIWLYTKEDKDDPRKQLTALCKDHPELHRACARLATSYSAWAGQRPTKQSVFELLARAEALHDPILAADKDHPIALLSRGMSTRTRYQWKESETALRRAKYIAANHSRVNGELALTLDLQGKLEEGIPMGLAVTDVNPLLPNAMVGRAWTLYYGRRYDELLRFAPTVIDRLDGDNRAQLLAFQALAMSELAQFGEAYKIAKQLPDDRPYWQANAVMVFAASNHLDEAIALREKIGPNAGLALSALMDDALGRTDAALTSLEKLVDNHHIEGAWLRMERFTTILRSQPRFQALMKKVFP